jgi:hypothetical protein
VAAALSRTLSDRIDSGSLNYFRCTAFLLGFGEKVRTRGRTNLFGLEFASFWSVNPESDNYPITGLLKIT